MGIVCKPPMQTNLLRQSLQREINDKRQASLIAARKGDYRMVAKLTTEVARLNQSLRAAMDAEVARPSHALN
jgi:hypothetical protein